MELIRNSRYYEADLLDPYQKLIQYWAMTFRDGNKPLDHMNFSRKVFTDVLDISDIQKIVQYEPGYSSPDGSIELGSLIKCVEASCIERNNPTTKVNLEYASVGVGHGTTNVMSSLIRAIIKLSEQKLGQDELAEIILPLPNYTVYHGQCRNLRNQLKIRTIQCKRENKFLPTYNEIKTIANKNTVAVILTYPNNPAQSTYKDHLVQELELIVKFCQENEIFLIADNVYQNCIHNSKRHEEIFSFSDKIDHLVKVYGPSKEIPFFCGYRCGYWIGDPVLQENYRYITSTTENSIGSISLILFAFQLLCRKKINDEDYQFVDEDIKYLDTGLFGWGVKIDSERLLRNLNESAILSSYKEKYAHCMSILEKANTKVRLFLSRSNAFTDYVNDEIGNLFFIKVNPTFGFQSDDKFFLYILEETRIGVLPGSAFGYEGSEIWFRITLVHDNIENILRDLTLLEKFLIQNRS